MDKAARALGFDLPGAGQNRKQRGTGPLPSALNKQRGTE